MPKLWDELQKKDQRRVIEILGTDRVPPNIKKQHVAKGLLLKSIPDFPKSAVTVSFAAKAIAAIELSKDPKFKAPRDVWNDMAKYGSGFMQPGVDKADNDVNSHWDSVSSQDWPHSHLYRQSIMRVQREDITEKELM